MYLIDSLGGRLVLAAFVVAGALIAVFVLAGPSMSNLTQPTIDACSATTRIGCHGLGTAGEVVGKGVGRTSRSTAGLNAGTVGNNNPENVRVDKG